MRAELEKLRQAGCNTDVALERCVNDEAFYFECVTETLKDPSFAALGEALKEGDAKVAYNHAHTLKGLLANMEMTPLYNIVVKLVEPLRQGNLEGLDVFYEELIAERDRFSEMIRKK